MIEMTTKRLEILKNSLAKKEALFNEKLDKHFDDVGQANGQPLNDKRNGQATMTRWEKQNESLRTLQESIEKTKAAIEIEEGKIASVECAKDALPTEILTLIESGELVQWRKHPFTFFVEGVEKGRIVWDKKKKIVAHKYYRQIPTSEQKNKFAKVFNALKEATTND